MITRRADDGFLRGEDTPADTFQLCHDRIDGFLTAHGGETDPNGLDPRAPGAKLDAGKIRPSLVFRGFANALTEVVKVGTYGANKYSDDGWLFVENGVERYEDAYLRHMLAKMRGEEVATDSEILHAAHEAWNALAVLELLLREKK